MTSLTCRELSQSQNNYLMPVNPPGQIYSLLPCAMPEKSADKHQPSKTLLPHKLHVIVSKVACGYILVTFKFPQKYCRGFWALLVQQSWFNNYWKHGMTSFVSALIWSLNQFKVNVKQRICKNPNISNTFALLIQSNTQKRNRVYRTFADLAEQLAVLCKKTRHRCWDCAQGPDSQLARWKRLPAQGELDVCSLGGEASERGGGCSLGTTGKHCWLSQLFVDICWAFFRFQLLD